MPWCPKCRNEYVEGIKVCADCGTELVESLEEERGIPLIFGDKEQMERLQQFLAYNKLKTAEIKEDREEGVYELYVSEEERPKAAMAVKVFLQQEPSDEAEELAPEAAQPGRTADIPHEEGAAVKQGNPGRQDDAGGAKASGYRGVYQNSAQKAEENRSSGYMLMIIGGAGLVAVLLIFLGVIRLPAAMANRVMVCAVMGALFLLFFVMGVLAMKSSKALAKKAESEGSLVEEIKRWCETNMNAQIVDEGLFPEGEPVEEIRYFKRTDKMKEMISRQFMNLDEGFLDSFVDDFYPVIFG